MNDASATTAWDTLAIVGPGLIGGSIGMAALQRGVARRVVGIGRHEDSLRAALARGAITDLALDLATGVRDADLVIVATPVDDIPRAIAVAAAACRPGTILTDAGSAKFELVERVDALRAAAPWPAGVQFVGGHPLAGSDKRGVEHAGAGLFVDRITVITPQPDSPRAAVDRLAGFWRALGAKVVEMSAAEHDQALAVTSHLPHLVAAAIAGSTAERYVTLTAGGWLDTTRIAASDPMLWRQILLANRSGVLAALDAFERRLGAFREALEGADAASLEQLLAESKRIRDAVAS